MFFMKKRKTNHHQQESTQSVASIHLSSNEIYFRIIEANAQRIAAEITKLVPESLYTKADFLDMAVNCYKNDTTLEFCQAISILIPKGYLPSLPWIAKMPSQEIKNICAIFENTNKPENILITELNQLFGEENAADIYQNYARKNIERLKNWRHNHKARFIELKKNREFFRRIGLNMEQRISLLDIYPIEELRANLAYMVQLCHYGFRIDDLCVLAAYTRNEKVLSTLIGKAPRLLAYGFTIPEITQLASSSEGYLNLNNTCYLMKAALDQKLSQLQTIWPQLTADSLAQHKIFCDAQPLLREEILNALSCSDRKAKLAQLCEKFNAHEVLNKKTLIPVFFNVDKSENIIQRLKTLYGPRPFLLAEKKDYCLTIYNQVREAGNPYFFCEDIVYLGTHYQYLAFKKSLKFLIEYGYSGAQACLIVDAGSIYLPAAHHKRLASEVGMTLMQIATLFTIANIDSHLSVVYKSYCTILTHKNITIDALNALMRMQDGSAIINLLDDFQLVITAVYKLSLFSLKFIFYYDETQKKILIQPYQDNLLRLYCFLNNYYRCKCVGEDVANQFMNTLSAATQSWPENIEKFLTDMPQTYIEPEKFEPSLNILKQHIYHLAQIYPWFDLLLAKEEKQRDAGAKMELLAEDIELQSCVTTPQFEPTACEYKQPSIAAMGNFGIFSAPIANDSEFSFNSTEVDQLRTLLSSSVNGETTEDCYYRPE